MHPSSLPRRRASAWADAETPPLAQTEPARLAGARRAGRGTALTARRRSRARTRTGAGAARAAALR
ncbi:hypothetical protein F8O03_09195 [Pseudoclavibacter terrae]|uniref:Uncharacterized protein n=1 Tax=Pseudoclavibacter terrae TaxID=1530195 RepID=A0A7J5B3N2_9MICO|nr:hypothetical protein F8O03_09195 [Pseudoclavibacter terrae]